MVWIFINAFPEPVLQKIFPIFVFPHVTLPLPATTRLAGFVVMMIPTGIAMYGTYGLIRLFQLYEMGRIFQPANVQCFRRLSRVLIWWFVASIVSRSLLSIALTLSNPPGQRIWAVELGSPDLTALLLGAILGVIAWVMEEGRNLQEEFDLTV